MKTIEFARKKAQENDANRLLGNHADVWTWKRSLSHQLCVDIKTYMEATDRRKLVAKPEFNNPMDKHAVKVERGNETVGHLPREFSRIAWYFFARSGEINVEVIGRRRHAL